MGGYKCFGHIRIFGLTSKSVGVITPLNLLKMGLLMGKVVRKIVGCGKSAAATLPVKYLRANKLKLGDEIELIFDGPILQISPLDNDEIKRKLGTVGASA